MADAKKKEEPTKPTPEEKLAAAEAEVDALVKKGLKALDEFEKLDQKQVDHIVAKASVAALNKHLVLAKMAVEETHRGLVEDKATKNIFACEHVTNYLAGQKTVGIIRDPGHQPDLHRHLQVADRTEDPLPDHLRLPPGRTELLRRGRQDRSRCRYRSRRS